MTLPVRKRYRDADDKRESQGLDDEGHGLGDEDHGLDDESQGLEDEGLVYVVPVGKVIIIVSPGRLSPVPTGRVLSPGRVK
ncbi:hypothetical protein Tco_0263368 [Tanacetum coccineum]